MRILQLILRKINFKGKGRIINMIFRKPFCGIVEYKNNLLIELDTQELICWNVYWNGGYENEVTWVIDKFVKDSDVVIDCGANIGIWTLLFANKAKAVHAIEPHPNFRKRLIQNLNLNRAKNCEVHSYGISSKEGRAILYSPPDSMKNKSASMLDLNPELSEKIEIEVRTFDSIFAHLDKIDFIKIDCDGSDADIILSGRRVIERHRPIIIFEDLGGYHEAMGSDELINSVDAAYDQAFDVLSELGYRTFKVLDGFLIDSGRIRGEYSNIIAIPPTIEID
jgi:FkbM family methyltransferase